METEKLSGWLEVLFRKDKIERMESLGDLKPEDYEMVGMPLHLEEFEGVYQVYEEYIRGGLPHRLLREYDVINLVLTDDEPMVASMLLLREQKNRHLIRPTDRLQWRRGRPLVGLMVKDFFPSYKK